jgi:prevent-host-death family protein
MTASEPTIQTIETSEVPERWRELWDQVTRHETRVILTENGAPAAAIVSAEELRQLKHYQQSVERDLSFLANVRAAFSHLSEEEIEREVSQAISEVRNKTVSIEQGPS